ncbi:outer membrane receptor protein [Owenweeksia hongkongensis DSM 17368]|uniref:Outer membrane receptor protein n=1 Tax=Owenweeksia hongkongensis (strain DSM 17368 / CIP 108786 / JCM 12287 / NRRL B-23963 / UST20020801) TaxID=926562 RepID=G8R311_OWEHD|nr:TonB-dependent receptor [Owenweeksia hongkongensis]AEV33005.1 outer membrane receptor protein [Owenweeksia hongkongensis DSM 17368]
MTKRLHTNLRCFSLISAKRRVMVLGLFLLFINSSLIAQSGVIKGTVKASNGEVLIGATAYVESLKKGGSVDAEGKFIINDVADGTYQVAFEFIGYKDKVQSVTVSGGVGTVNAVLEESSEVMDEVIVTGVFDERTKLQSSVAISTLNSKEIARLSPTSAADVLKDVPGVFVNSSLGEIRNVVYSRGVSANSTDGDRGYYYVSMQEDGLPVTNVTYGNYGPDYFLRNDITVGRVEAVRGGSAAIFGPNAPGGIFNYISNTGKKDFEGAVRLKAGLLSGENPYYRADLNLSGALNETGDLTYNLGGFYRYDNGYRNPGYAMNYGGQLKANIVKRYSTGSIKLYAKMLDDHNAWFEFSPAVNYDNPQLAPGVSNTDAYLPSKDLTFKYKDNFGEEHEYDPTNLVHSKDYAVGMDWNQLLGNGWKINNNMKYTSKQANWNTGAVITFVGLESVFPYLFTNTLNPNSAGTYTFTDMVTGQEVAQVFSASGFDHTVTNSDNLPGQDIQANSVMLQGLFVNQNRVNELMDQFIISKKLDKMTFSLGGFVAQSNVKSRANLAAVALSTIENQPHPLNVTITDGSGNVKQVTDPNGVAGAGRASFTGSDVIQNQAALFFGHSWEITSRLHLDYGARYDVVSVDGTNLLASSGVDDGTGGDDGDVSTLYDNYAYSEGDRVQYNHTVKTFSYSAALNYMLNEKMAIYGRFSNGKKSPDLLYYLSANSKFAASTLDPKAQDLKQAEIGFKTTFKNLNIIATPFYSLLSNVPTSTTGLDTAGLNYNTPILLNEIETFGLELELNYKIKKFSVRGVFTAQKATAKKWEIWILGNDGMDDDVTEDYSGNAADNNPKFMFNISPAYSITKNIDVFANWRFMGARPANVANTFELPSFHQFDLGATYTPSQKWDLTFNVVNLLNGTGVMSWQAPGGFPASLDRQGFTPDVLAADPNSTFGIVTIQPRSYYLTVTYRF